MLELINIYRYRSVDSLTKLSYGSNRCLLDYCNANATYIRKAEFGITDKDGKFNGIVAGLLNGEGDISGKNIFLQIG